MGLTKKFDCDICTKNIICKLKEIEVPEVISRVETKLDNQVYNEDIIKFYVCCSEFQQK